MRGGPGRMICLIAAKGVYFLVVMAPPKECLPVLPKNFEGRLIPGANVTPCVSCRADSVD